MCSSLLRTIATMLVCLLVSLPSVSVAAAQAFLVTLDPPVYGNYRVSPSMPADGRVAAGTVLTVTAQPDDGYVLDAGYYATPGPWGPMFYESKTATFKVVVKQDMRVGVSFIERSAVAHVSVKKDVVYAKPGVKPLKYDVYRPRGAKAPLPIIVIIHGGGWITNDEGIMRGLARELTRGAQFVAVSIDYRWAGKADGDATGNSMAHLIEDVFGAIAHIREHANQYGGDPSRIVLTGDSAGGHLAAVGSLMVDKIGDGGFGQRPGVFEFKPSYLPKGQTSADVRRELLLSIKAAAPSYGVFGGPLLSHHYDNPVADASWIMAVSPIHHVPKASVRAVPQFLIRGTQDPVITDAMCRSFMDALVEAGQRVEYVQVGGAGHAFFDWKPDAETQARFKAFGVYHAAQMKAFFASVLGR